MSDQKPNAQIDWSPVISQALPIILPQLFAFIAGLLHKQHQAPAPVNTVPGFYPPSDPKPSVVEEPLVNPPPSAPVPPAQVFSASQLNVLDVNGEEYNPVNAINWGSYIRLDSNPKDQFGKPLAKELIDPASPQCVVQSIEWKSLWDGAPDKAGKCHLNVGGNLYNNSNGYAISAKVFKEGEDDKRHTLDVWVTYHLKAGGTVDSNEVRFQVD